jgi:hypothetical protein
MKCALDRIFFVLKFSIAAMGMVLLSGCSSYELLVKKDELKPVERVQIKFDLVYPSPDGNELYPSLSRSLDRGGYYNGRFELEYIGEMLREFRENGVQAESASTYWGPGNSVPTYSHRLVIRPVSFFASGPNKDSLSAMLDAEVTLIDVVMEKPVWKRKVMTGVPMWKEHRVAKDILLDWKNIGVIKLKPGDRIK